MIDNIINIIFNEPARNISNLIDLLKPETTFWESHLDHSNATLKIDKSKLCC